MALVALVVTGPPDALAAIVLAGCGILGAALLVSIGHVVFREMRRTPSTKS